AADHVVAAEPPDLVVPAAGEDDVGAVRPVDPFVRGGADDGRGLAVARGRRRGARGRAPGGAREREGRHDDDHDTTPVARDGSPRAAGAAGAPPHPRRSGGRPGRAAGRASSPDPRRKGTPPSCPDGPTVVVPPPAEPAAPVTRRARATSLR